jgi:hypothetical protein
MAEAASQKTQGVMEGRGKPKTTATPIAPVRHPASPRISPKMPMVCAECEGPEPCRDNSCFAYEPEKLQTRELEPKVSPAPLDNPVPNTDTADVDQRHRKYRPREAGDRLARFLDGDNEKEELSSINVKSNLDNWEEL